jgi:hypothetical protein
MQTNLKNTTINMIIVGTTVLITLGILEIILHLITPEKIKQGELKNDDALVYKFTPGGEIDARGYRNQNGCDVCDVVAIGDSQTYGQNAESTESWPAAIEHLSDLSVYNMAVPGYGPLQYEILTERATDLGAKTILWGLYMGNDLFDAYYFTHRDSGNINVESFTPPPVTESNLIKFRKWWRKHSYIYALIGNATYKIRDVVGLAYSHGREREEVAKKWAAENPELGEYYDDPLVSTTFTPTYRRQVLDLNDFKIREGLDLTKETLLRNKDVIFVLIPTKEAVYGRMPEEAIVRDEILNLCNTNNLKCLDVLPAMQQALTERALYRKDSDGHPTAVGYKVIADTVFEYLRHSIEQETP